MKAERKEVWERIKAAAKQCEVERKRRKQEQTSTPLFTEADVWGIRRAYDKRMMSMRELASLYTCSVATIHNVVSGATYKSVKHG